MDSHAFLLGEPKEVGAGIARFRLRHQLSQVEMAARCNIGVRTLQYLESKGVRPSPLTALKLDDAMCRIERQAQKKETA